MQQMWNILLISKEKRHQMLKASYIKQKFLAELKDLQLWADELLKQMCHQEKPKNVAEVNILRDAHMERKIEIDRREPVFRNLFEFQSKSSSKDKDVENAQSILHRLHDTLLNIWSEEDQRLNYQQLLQEFKLHTDQIDSWLASKEAFLNNVDQSENPRTIELLISKHQAFDKTLNQQITKVDHLKKVETDCFLTVILTSVLLQFAEDIVDAGDYDDAFVKEQLERVLDRKDQLLLGVANRTRKLEELKSLYEFHKNINEVNNWLAQKTQIALDENYQDLSNLQSKIQKHVAFDAEIFANRSRLQSISDEGQRLISSSHFAAASIQSNLEELESNWKRLCELSALKRDRLNEAYEAFLFDRLVEEFIVWLDDAEKCLNSSDFGKDLASVNNLLKRHTALETDFQQHLENCDSIQETSEQFVKNDHFMSSAIQKKANDVIARYYQLNGLLQVRRDGLDSSRLVYQFCRDVDVELQWLVDKEPFLASQDLGKLFILCKLCDMQNLVISGSDLQTVNNLLKKHQTMESELLSRQSVIASLVERAAYLKSPEQSLHQEVQEKTDKLKTKLYSLTKMASSRKLKLQEAVKSQMVSDQKVLNSLKILPVKFYVEAAEAQTWLNDKRPIVTSNEIGEDEDSTQMLQRKLDVFKCEIQTFETTIQHLKELVQNVGSDHFDSSNISSKMVSPFCNALQSFLF